MTENNTRRKRPTRPTSQRRTTLTRRNTNNEQRNTTRRNTGKKYPNVKSAKTLKTPNGDVVKIIVLGGLEEVGRNCTLIEYKNDIIIIDLGHRQL